MRICLVYDCLFPYTVGGAERWYRNLGERLAAEGHQVTYLTLRQWSRGGAPDVAGVDVRAVGPRMTLYSGPGRRRILPPLVFGAGVLWHLLRHRRRYDVVHTASFPYFSLLAAGLARPVAGFRLVVDWHEVWSYGYWTDYLGRVLGTVGFGVQRLCALITQRAFCFSRLHAARLKEEGLRGEVTILEGEYAGPELSAEPLPAQPLVVFAGRHIREKRVPAVVGAVMLAAQRIPGLRGVVFGDGPDRSRVLDAIREAGASGVVEAPGFVEATVVDETLGRALCMLLPSRREGYGLIVVEAAALGVPSIVVREPDNAATELVSEGENGIISPSAAPADLADAIVRICEAGPGLRDSTAAWYRRNQRRLSLENSLDVVVAGYSDNVGQQLMTYRVLHVLPHAGAGAQTYINVLGALDGFSFATFELSTSRSPAAAAASIAARQPRLYRAARDADLIHAHGELASLLSLPLLGSKRSVIVLHGLHLVRRLEPGVPQLLGRTGLRTIVTAADRAICSSQAEYDDLYFLPERLRAKVAVVRNSVPLPPQADAAARARKRGDLGLAEDAVAVLYIGQLEPRKDPHTVVRAVMRAHGEDARIVLLVAGRGPSSSELAALGGAEVRLLGQRGDVSELLDAADIFVMPSQREGMSFAILEALGHGIATVVSDGAGNPETVGDAGLVFPVGDDSRLATLILELAADPMRRKALGSAGRARLATELTTERMLEETRAVYEAVLRAPGRGAGGPPA